MKFRSPVITNTGNSIVHETIDWTPGRLDFRTSPKYTGNSIVQETIDWTSGLPDFPKIYW